jgi:adenylate kinase family enzyme
MAFASFVGNQAVVSEAKREFKAARVVLVVGPPSGGKTTFVRCLEKHFESDLRFVRPDLDSGDTKSTLWSIATRKSGVMEAFASGVEFDVAQPQRDLRIVLDDVDTSERGLSSMIEELILGTPRSVGVVMVLDSAGLRKMSQLKKKGALVLSLSPPGKDAVQRWARRELLDEDSTESDHARLRAILKACNNNISRARAAFEQNRSSTDVVEDIKSLGAEDVDNATTIARLFKTPLSVSWLMDVVCLDGGSMLGQLAWHNSSAFMDSGYDAALKKSLYGMVLERSAHLRHDPSGSALGHALSLSPYADITKHADRSAMTYTTTMAHGGARAVARRTLATMTDDRSVAERAWDSCQKTPASKARKRAAPKKKQDGL